MSGPEPVHNGTAFQWSKRRVVLLTTFIALAVAAGLFGLGVWNRQQLQVAEAALERREFEQAEFHLKKRWPLGFSDLNGHLLSVRTARRRGDLEAANRRLQACQKRSGSDEWLELEQQLLAIQQGNLEGVDELIDRYAANPQLPEAPWVLEAYIVGSLKILMSAYAQNLTHVGSESSAHLERTRRFVEQWLASRTQKPDQVQGLVWRFQAHLFAHALSEARTDIDRALELDPNHREARIMLAIFLTQEHPAEAAMQWQQLHEHDPDDVKTTLNFADVRRRLGHLEEAQALLDQALAQEPKNIPALLDRGRVAQDLQDLAGAEIWFRNAYHLDPASPEANLALSRCLQALGKTQAAMVFQDNFDRFQAEHRRQREAAKSLTPH